MFLGVSNLAFGFGWMVISIMVSLVQLNRDVVLRYTWQVMGASVKLVKVCTVESASLVAPSPKSQK